MDSDSHIEPGFAEYPEAGPFWVDLWAAARHWMAILAHVFEPDVIAGPGVTRRLALRCLNWLWPIEGLVRRLIIAAAMKLDVPHVAASVARSRKTPPHRTATATFAVLPRPPERQPIGSPRAGRPPPEHRHLFFPGDDLLRLFPRRGRRNAPALRWRNPQPLKRRGRVSRWDPDYAGVSENPRAPRRAQEDSSAPRRSTPTGTPAGRPRVAPYSEHPEWKRVELEWERVIPAPCIAGRIRALMRVLEKPERWIARTARRLSADLLSKIRALPPPQLGSRNSTAVPGPRSSTN